MFWDIILNNFTRCNSLIAQAFPVFCFLVFYLGTLKVIEQILLQLLNIVTINERTHTDKKNSHAPFIRSIFLSLATTDCSNVLVVFKIIRHSYLEMSENDNEISVYLFDVVILFSLFALPEDGISHVVKALKRNLTLCDKLLHV